MRVSLPSKQFKPQGYKVKAQPSSNGLHEFIVLGVLKFDNLPGFDINQVIVMRFFTRFITRSAATKVATFKDAVLLEEADGAVDRGDGDMLIECRGTAIKLLNVRMVARLGQDTRDNPALSSHLQAPFDAEALDARYHSVPCRRPTYE